MANTDLSGQILDSSGTAIPNAQVYLWREDLVGARGFVAQTTANSNGEFTFTGHPDGTGTSETWHVAAEDPQGNSQLQSAYGVSAALPKTANSQFDTTITSASPDPVGPGQALDVTVDVTNTGDESDTQTVTLSIDNSVGQVDSTSVTLSGGGSVTKTLSWSVPSNQTKQDYQATVASADDTASQTVTVNNVPAADHLYNASTLNLNDGDIVSTWPDEQGSRDLSAIGSPTYDTANGIGSKPAIDFGGGSDEYAFENGSLSLSQPTTIFAVIDIKATQINGDHGIVDHDGSGDRQLLRFNAGTNWDVFAGSSLGGSTDTSITQLTAVCDGTSSVLREEGVQTGSGDAGTEGLSGIDVGRRGGGDSWWVGKIAEIRLFDKRLSSAEIDSVELELANKYGTFST